MVNNIAGEALLKDFATCYMHLKPECQIATIIFAILSQLCLPSLNA